MIMASTESRQPGDIIAVALYFSSPKEDWIPALILRVATKEEWIADRKAEGTGTDLHYGYDKFYEISAD